jgi:long-chain acyl-CoA synthetase
MTSLISSELLWQEFVRQTAPHGASTAVCCSQNELSFVQVAEFANRIADWLQPRVSARALVAHSLPNVTSFAPTFLALCRLGAIIPMLSPKYREAEIQQIFSLLPIEHVVTTPQQAQILAKILPATDIFEFALPGLSESVALLTCERLSQDTIDLDTDLMNQAAIIKLTSGSTGTPKGVVLTAKNVLASAQIVCRTLGVQPGDRIVSPVPMFHSYGFDLGLLPMITAGAAVSPSDLFVPRILLRELANPQTRIFLGVPSMYQALVDSTGAVPDLSHIRYLLSCTAPLNPSLIQAFRNKFGVSICQHYGSSETGGATIHSPAHVAVHEDSVGQAMVGVRIELLDADDKPVPVGCEGEVVIASEAVSLGYIIGAPTDRVVLANGQYRTSDIGTMDEDGFLTLRGRIDQLINVGGLKVSPLEVQQVLERHPAVREVAVLGIRDESGSEYLHAAVSLKASASESDLLDHCRQSLAEYKVPRRIDIMSELPRGGTGKIVLKREDLSA